MTLDEITLLEAKRRLKESHPALLYTQEGFVAGVNLLAVWLWEAEEPHQLLGVHIVDILGRNLKRIPREKNSEFYATKRAEFLEELIAKFGEEPYSPYLQARKDDPLLVDIVKKGRLLHLHEFMYERGWQHNILIVAPKGGHFAELLEFQVTVYRIENDAGFLAIYEPSSEKTQKIVQQKLTAIKAVEDVIEYVQYQEDKKKEGDLTMAKEQRPETKAEKSGEPTGKYNQWTAILGFMKVAEEEEEELTKQGVVKGPIDDIGVWNKSEE